jgi:hypothetical protein
MEEKAGSSHVDFACNYQHFMLKYYHILFLFGVYIMTIRDIVDLLGCEVCCCDEHLDSEVHTACGSDMMSDVLAFVKDQAVLLTGLLNPQVVRTAEMMDIICIVFVRGKKPDDSVVRLAEQRGIVVLATCDRMFEACGKLYQHGLQGGKTDETAAGR